jgi:hypothetical protein
VDVEAFDHTPDAVMDNSHVTADDRSHVVGMVGKGAGTVQTWLDSEAQTVGAGHLLLTAKVSCSKIAAWRYWRSHGKISSGSAVPAQLGVEPCPQSKWQIFALAKSALKIVDVWVADFQRSSRRRLPLPVAFTMLTIAATAPPHRSSISSSSKIAKLHLLCNSFFLAHKQRSSLKNTQEVLLSKGWEAAKAV